MSQREIYNKTFKVGDGFSKDKERFERYFSFLNDIKKEDYILDVGCGPGPLEIYLNKNSFKNVIAVDFAFEGVKLAKK